ncbi:MAG: hypothetical protein WA061_03135 [Microgenomates group bacterium]
MDPKEYYYNRFRGQFEEWLKKSHAHKHFSQETFIPLHDLNPTCLSHVPKTELGLFYCALGCTILIDQIIYTHFKSDYPKFQQLTQYPKIEYGTTNTIVNPWQITRRGTGTTTLTRFLQFFVSDLKEFYRVYPFKTANWETVKSAMLGDAGCMFGKEGIILKDILERS